MDWPLREPPPQQEPAPGVLPHPLLSLWPLFSWEAFSFSLVRFPLGKARKCSHVLARSQPHRAVLGARAVPRAALLWSREPGDRTRPAGSSTLRVRSGNTASSTFQPHKLQAWSARAVSEEGTSNLGLPATYGARQWPSLGASPRG